MIPEPSAPRHPDLVDRDFTASRPDQLWVADMTYVRTWSGWAYVAFVLDVYSRMIVGWPVANHMRTELPLDAPEMALWRRRVKKDSGPIHHSDRGSQYVSIRYTDRLGAKVDQAGERARFYGEVLAAEKKIVAGVILAGGRGQA
ncbi:DDE-type integrase/transposase/recombinase [Streptomyces wuyuanensis]|uniref:DDE-type integrase/transposase/recombinase n=1 Tax=Streptomyces wuyuanensis TaxID=1196353 RepID=UPI0036825414